MISWFMRLGLMSGSVLTAWSLLGILSSSPLLSLSLKINKYTLKIRKKRFINLWSILKFDISKSLKRLYTCGVLGDEVVRDFSRHQMNTKGARTGRGLNFLGYACDCGGGYQHREIHPPNEARILMADTVLVASQVLIIGGNRWTPFSRKYPVLPVQIFYFCSLGSYLDNLSFVTFTSLDWEGSAIPSLLFCNLLFSHESLVWVGRS